MAQLQNNKGLPFLTRTARFLNTIYGSSPEVGLTPRELVWQKNKSSLWYYPASEKKYRVPLFFIYSFINQPFILDLGPGHSLIEALNEKGYDVYLFDFGIAGYEDKDITIDDYISSYIKRGVQRALYHSGASEISLVGFCMGGTFAAIYTAIAEEPIKNLILAVAPFDFSHFPAFDEWVKVLRNGQVDVQPIIDTIGNVPPLFMKSGIRLITSPIYLSPYLSLFSRATDETYSLRWKRLNDWTDSHIPFPGTIFKQVAKSFGQENALIKGTFSIHDTPIDLRNIHSSLLVVGSEMDRLVPPSLIDPIMDLTSSTDKTFYQVKGGHATLTSNKKVQNYLDNWLSERSDPIV